VADLANYETPMALFEDSKVAHFGLGSSLGSAKQLISEAVICSAKLNFALNASAKLDFVPLADASPYGDLLGAKYA
jgi:hypothetical protein